MQQQCPSKSEQAIISWLSLFPVSPSPESLLQLCDGSVFLLILTSLPKFKLTQQLTIDDSQAEKIHYKLKNLRVIYDSLKLYYQTKLLKDTSKFNVSISEACAGNTREMVKFVEVVAGAFLWSEGKGAFLQKILGMDFQHQEAFMGIIKNAMNLSEDMEEGFGSPGRRARSLLDRIDQLQEQAGGFNRKIQELQMQLIGKREHIQALNRSAFSVREQNRLLTEELSNLRSPQKIECNTSRLQFSILQQKLSIQKNNYQLRIKEYEAALNETEEKLFQASKSRLAAKQLTEKNQILSHNLDSIQVQFDKGMTLLKQKDELIGKLRKKNQQYQSRILGLEADIEETAPEKQSQGAPGRQRFPDNPLDSYRQSNNLREEMNSVIQQLTLENSRLVTEKAVKEEEYQSIILNQRSEIKILKNQNKPMPFKKRNPEVVPNARNQNLSIMSNQSQERTTDIVKLVDGLKSGHFQEVGVLVSLVQQLMARIDQLEEEKKREKATKDIRAAQLVKRANTIRT